MNFKRKVSDVEAVQKKRLFEYIRMKIIKS